MLPFFLDGISSITLITAVSECRQTKDKHDAVGVALGAGGGGQDWGGLVQRGVHLPGLRPGGPPPGGP